MKKQIIIVFCTIIIKSVVFAQFDFIGRKINSNAPKAIPSSYFKSKDTIPKIDFKFDSIRPLNELKTKSGNSEVYPWLSTDGNRIYYTEQNSRQLLYMADKKTEEYKFSNPHALYVNSSDSSIDNYSAWLTNDELNIYFIQSSITECYLCHAKRDSINQNFSTPTHVSLIGKNIINIFGPSFTQDLDTLYLANSNDAGTNGNIYIFYKTAVDEYTFYSSMQIPNNLIADVGALTCNNLNYFLSLSINNYNPYKLYLFKRDSVEEQFTKLYYINNPYINDTNYVSIISPYFSISNNILTYSRWQDSGIVVGNNFVLYLAYNFKEYDNIKENIALPRINNIFPNPTQNYIELLSTIKHYSCNYYISTLTGQILKSGSFTNEIILDLSSINKGIYILTISEKKYNQKASYKIIKL